MNCIYRKSFCLTGLTPTDEIPPVPNVDVFNFSAIKNKVFEQLDAFSGIPFTGKCVFPSI